MAKQRNKDLYKDFKNQKHIIMMMDNCIPNPLKLFKDVSKNNIPRIYKELRKRDDIVFETEDAIYIDVDNSDLFYSGDIESMDGVNLLNKTFNQSFEYLKGLVDDINLKLKQNCNGKRWKKFGVDV